MRQSCRIVNDQVFGHVCGGDHGRADGADGSPTAPREPPRTTARLPRRGPPRRSARGVCHTVPVPLVPSGWHVPRAPLSACRTPRVAREPFTSGKARGKHLFGGVGPEVREEWADQARQAATGPGRTRARPGRRVRSLPYDGTRAPERRAPPPPAPEDRGPAAGGVSRCTSSPRAASGPTVPWGSRPTWLRDAGIARHGPICRLRAADLVVYGEEVGQQGNWPESAATCCRLPWRRCGGSCGCRGSCRPRGCWSGRRSR